MRGSKEGVGMQVPRLLRRSVIPFLVLAEPLLFVLFQGSPYCRPVCFQPTTAGLAGLGVALIGTAFVAGFVTVWLADERLPRFLGSPSNLTIALLLGVFVTFVAVLGLETTSSSGTVWTPVLWPVSVLLFFPVWLLYAATFPLSILADSIGLTLGAGGTIVVRGVVVVAGFGLSALWQATLAMVITEAASEVGREVIG